METLQKILKERLIEELNSMEEKGDIEEIMQQLVYEEEDKKEDEDIVFKLKCWISNFEG